jgi:nucleotide-binding universal stress UspA family protein
MSKPILVGYDPRGSDRAPIDLAIRAAEFTGAPPIVASVETGRGHDPKKGHVDDELVDDCGPALEQVEARMREAGVAYESRRLQSSSAARGLHEAAEELDAGLLVVGPSRRSAVGRIVIGGTGTRLLHGAPCAVAVAPREWTPKGRIDTIGVAYVDSDEGHEALRSAHALARRAGATLKVYTIVKTTPSSHLETDARQTSWQHERRDMVDVEGGHLVDAEQHVNEVVGALGGDVTVEAAALSGHPADEIVRLSGLVDLMIAGSRGYGPRRAVLLGSVSQRLMEEAQCPSIVLPRGVEGPLEALMADAPGTPAAA